MGIEELNQLGGWEDNPTLRQDVCAASATFQGSFYSVRPEARGAGAGKVVLLFQAFNASNVLGVQPKYRAQTIGSCVGRTGGMLGDLLCAMQAAAGETVWPGHTLAASVYGFARIEVGRGIHGQRPGGEGAVVPYAIEAVSKLGVLHEGKIEAGGKSYDFTGQFDSDALCSDWGSRGVPDALEPEAKRHVYQHWAEVSSYEEARDAIAAGSPIYFGTSQSFWGRSSTRNSQGILRASGSTAHSWSAVGTIDDGNLVGLVLDNKQWGDDWCGGPEGPYPIGNGRFVCVPEDFEKLLAAGEAFAVSGYSGLDVPVNVIPDFTKW